MEGVKSLGWMTSFSWGRDNVGLTRHSCFVLLAVAVWDDAPKNSSARPRHGRIYRNLVPDDWCFRCGCPQLGQRNFPKRAFSRGNNTTTRTWDSD
eukprot:scaffold578_cov167-Amphora_coffeaeformis.AAC.48